MPDFPEDLNYNIFSNSSQCMAIYDSQSQSFKEMNRAMEKKMGGATIENITKIFETTSNIYVQLSGIPCHMKILATIDPNMSIVELFPAHTKRWSQESDLVKLTDLTSDGVWEWFPTLNFEYMSERFWSILGYSQEDMPETPRAWMDFINPDDKVKCMQMYEEHVRSRGSSPYHETVKYSHKDGRDVFVLCRGTVVHWLPDGRPWRLLGTHTDVTDIVKKDAVEAQSTIIARMSHEIRSPICTILNECELLGSELKSKVITQTCQQLLSLTDDILSLRETKKDDIKLDQKTCDLSAILHNCNKRHRLAAKKKGIRIKVSTGDLPELVLIDEVKFNQVLDNLLVNSVKYSDAGVVTIDVDYHHERQLCEVRVRDQGYGIPLALQSSVFQEFVQGDNTMQGAGIGLSLTRRLSGLMGGSVVIENSKEGVGTTMLFTSILPLVERTMSDAGVGATPNPNVMVVDDMHINRCIIIRRLCCASNIGIHFGDVVEATDGKDALLKFRESGGNFQLILMDCLMPVLDGFQATVSIHDECAKLGLEPVPVVAVTASVSSDIHNKCYQHGMKFVVTKPYTEQDLLLSIQSCMNSKFQHA